MYFTPTLTTGYNAYIDSTVDDLGTQMDIGLLILEAGESYTYHNTEKEVVILLFEGKVTYAWEGQTAVAERQQTIGFEGTCLHVCRDTEVTVTADNHVEMFVQATINERKFDAKLYTPETTQLQQAGANGELMGCMRRDIKTYFDYENAPYSNMVLGEVLSHPGRWSSYPPHFHPQPEVYFYRFDYPNGFGAGFANDEIYRTGHNGCAVINHGMHSQVSAAGYAMCYAWGIRHLEGDPWEKTRIDEPEHSWLWKDDANDHIFKG